MNAIAETSPSASVRRGAVLGAARPWGLLTASAVVAVVLVLPPVFLMIETWSAGLSLVRALLFRRLMATLLWNTIQLTVCVTFLCAVIGTASAWFVERTDVPFRRLLSGIVVVPLAIPDFVVAFGWSSVSTWVQGFHGAIVVMTLALYPLVYLPVAASFRHTDSGQEEVARSLGVGRIGTFVRITLGQARTAILGGCLLVVLVMFAEYGAFELVGFRTFSTEIYIAFSVAFNVPAAAALSLALIGVSILVVTGESLLRGKGRVSRSGPLALRAVTPHRLGRARVLVLGWFALLIALAIGVPVYETISWSTRGIQPVDYAALMSAVWDTVSFSAPAAAIATLMAVPVALLVTRYPSRLHHALERSTYLVLAMPTMIGFAVSYFTGRYVHGFAYQSAPLLVVSYAILYFPFALVAVRASAVRIPLRLEEVGVSLGRSRLAVFVRVTLPLLAPGLTAAFCLVFLSSVIELTTTLILIPTGTQTLATQFWTYSQNLAYSQAAPYALAMVALAVVPSFVLARFFSRTPVEI